MCLWIKRFYFIFYLYLLYICFKQQIVCNPKQNLYYQSWFDKFLIFMDNDKLIFYDIMWYPVPSRAQVFELDESDRFGSNQDIDWGEDWKLIDPSFSRDSCNVYMSDYLDIINKYERLYRSIPFVKHIYLCNSITFNALHSYSDIDILIVARHNKIWIARFFSVLLFTIFGIRNNAKPHIDIKSWYRKWDDLWLWGHDQMADGHAHNSKKQKFCLSFYVDEDNLNFYKILLQPIDIYFIYWLAHLVPLYTNDRLHLCDIWKHNRRLKDYLPNHALDQEIQIGNKLIVWNNKFKDTVEYIFWSIIGRGVNKIIKFLWMPILTYKLKKLGKKGRWVIISDQMLKFHLDMRKIYLMKYNNWIKKKNI